MAADSECPICDRPFKRCWLEQYYCSTACSRRAAEIRLWCEARVGVIEPPRCGFCHAYFDADYPQQKFCSRSCLDKAKKLDAAERADIELGKNIANARKNARWTQADLALLVGIYERYLGSIEEGKAVMSAGLRDRILGLLAPYDTPARHCVWCESPSRRRKTRGRPIAAANARSTTATTGSSAGNTSTSEMAMRTILAAPPPPIDPTAPELLPVVELVKLEMALLKLEQPTLTDHQALREARRRHAPAMAEAIDQIDARRYGIWLGKEGAASAMPGA